MADHALWWPGDERIVLPVLEKIEMPATSVEDIRMCGAAIATTLDFTPKVEGLEIDPDGVNVAVAADNLLKKAWPAMYDQALSILTVVYPVRYTNAKRWPSGGAYGTRASDLKYFGHVYATTDTLLGFLEGVVASLGNWKLYSAGILTETWDAKLFANASSASAKMALRDERMAPMGTALHATYATAHIVALYQGVMQVMPSQTAEERLAVCQARLTKGWAALADVLTPTAGAEWISHFTDTVTELSA